MKRLVRRAFAALAALSLLLCAAACALWVRSYWRGDEITVGYLNHRPHPGHPTYRDADVLLALHRAGRWAVAYRQASCVSGPSFHRAGPGPDGRHWGFSHPEAGEWTERELNAWGHNTPPPPTSFRYAATRYARTFAFPDGALVALLGLAPAVRLAAAMRNRRRRDGGLCAGCGYDLRATPDRCPECGATPLAPARRARPVSGDISHSRFA